VSYDLGGGRFLDIDVKNWNLFSPSFKEAFKLQKDIVIHWLSPSKGQSFDTLRWAIPKKLQGNNTAIEQWMLKQFGSLLVRSRIAQRDMPTAIAEFKKALANGLVEFY